MHPPRAGARCGVGGRISTGGAAAAQLWRRDSRGAALQACPARGPAAAPRRPADEQGRSGCCAGPAPPRDMGQHRGGRVLLSPPQLRRRRRPDTDRRAVRLRGPEPRLALGGAAGREDAQGSGAEEQLGGGHAQRRASRVRRERRARLAACLPGATGTAGLAATGAPSHSGRPFSAAAAQRRCGGGPWPLRPDPDSLSARLRRLADAGPVRAADVPHGGEARQVVPRKGAGEPAA
mmetsp:Transcript_2808/g.8116  ORF Transcript_2808/g.8116 Transcript_2808/m.8116 type:complete len:235 (+) Transcript_2808:152-856(+)